MSVVSDLRLLVATLIHDAGEGTWNPAGYTDAEAWPIHLRKTPPSPDEVITLGLYVPGGRYRLGMQVRLRSSAQNATTAEDKAAAIRAALHGQRGLTHGVISVEQLTFLSQASLGLDKNGRDEVTVNFAALTSDPVTAVDHD